MADDRENAKTQSVAPAKPGLELPSLAAAERQPSLTLDSVGSETTEATERAAEQVALPPQKIPAVERVAPKKAARRRPSATAKTRQTKPRNAARPAAKHPKAAQPEVTAPQRPERRKKLAPARRGASGQAAELNLSPFGEAAVAACAESGTRAARGLETLSREILTFGRSTVDANFAQARALLAARSLDEALALQSNFTSAQIGALVGEAAKLGRLGATLAQEALAPLKAQTDAAARGFVRSKAA